jgi:peptidyl-prolyl cis-trans isomerase C
MKTIQLVGLCASLALAACSKDASTQKPAEAAAPTSPPAFTVNGKPISQDFLEAYTKAIMQGKPSSELSDHEREAVRENLARFELIAQQAEKDGMLKDPALTSRIELTRLNLIQQAVAQKYFKENEPTEAEMRAEYETQLASAPLVEYQARHILVTNEDVAQKIIARLKSGANFADIAKGMSKDTESARRGGDLGWFGPNDFDREFVNAVAMLKKGEVTAAPVQTRAGWHVIQLTNMRDAEPKPFEQVKPQLAQFLVGKKYKSYSDAMLKTARIEPPLKSQQASTAPTAPIAPAAPTAPAAPAAPANGGEAVAPKSN